MLEQQKESPGERLVVCSKKDLTRYVKSASQVTWGLAKQMVLYGLVSAMKGIRFNEPLSREDQSLLCRHKNLLVPATHPGGT